jgi:hypothetical protein
LSAVRRLRQHAPDIVTFIALHALAAVITVFALIFTAIVAVVAFFIITFFALIIVPQ